jgi:tripeptide aminopeptidase
MDTVGPGEGIRPLVVDGVVKSDGNTVLGADDKAGIAVILEALSSVLESGMKHGRVEIVLTVAEEIGLLGSKNLDLSQLQARRVFVLDGEGEIGGIVVRAPSQNSIRATFKGRSAHAGLNPEAGINAIDAAAEAITCMTLGRIDEETTANVGIIRGGRAANIVPDEAYLEGEARSLSEESLDRQTREMEKCLQEGATKLGAQVEALVTRAYSSFNLGLQDAIVKIALEAAENLGIKARLASTGGGSDTNVFNESGLPAVNLSVGYENVHTAREKIPVKNLEKAAQYLVEIISVVASHRGT